MKIKIIRNDNQMTHIALTGKLDVAGEQEIGEEFRRLVDSQTTPFLVDMSQVTYLASLGIRLLFAAAKVLAVKGRKMVVLKPQPMVEETLLTSGTVKLIPIAHDQEEALGMLGG